jgi:arylsulfatase A-like enzyme
MLGDEVGWNNVGWHSNITISSNMNELAKAGLTLNRAYVQRWCAPTRTAVMTGRYPYNVSSLVTCLCHSIHIDYSGRNDGLQPWGGRGAKRCTVGI